MQPLFQNLRSKTTQSRKLLLIVSTALLVVGVVSVLFINRTQTEKQEPTAQKPTFTNYLKPKSEIKVGENRYVSACQLITIDKVTSVFGDVGDDTFIREKYYDTTPLPQSGLDKGVTTSCSYDLGKKEVSLEAEQLFKQVDTTELQLILHPLGDEQMDEKIKLYEKAVASSNNGALKAFVADMKQSVKTYQEQGSADTPQKADTEKLVVPVDYGLFSFNVIENNVIYKLDYKVGSTGKEEFSLSDQEISDSLNKSYKAIEIIKQRAADIELDQSPAPTILGDTEKIGTTKILEPCALLTAQLYQAVAGSSANREINRATVFNNIIKERTSPGDGSPLYPLNSCERNGKAGDTSTSIRLSMRHTKSAEALQAALNKGFKFDGPDDKLLQTNADWAGYFNASKTTAGCVFRVGPYSMDVSILHTASGGLFDDIKQKSGNEQQCVQLINSIADSVKEFSK